MRTFRAALSALLILSAGVTAEAHAFLDRAEPRVGSSVPSAPRELSLWFTQNLEAAFSSVAVSDSNGTRVAQWRCAGCGEPTGGREALALADGNRVHFDNLDCAIRYGERWRGTASRMLIAMGLQQPTGEHTA